MDSTNTYYFNRNMTVFFIFLLFILAIFVRILCFGGYLGSDDAEYANYAYNIVNNDFAISKYFGLPHMPLRLGLIMPVALAFKIAGRSELTMLIYPFFLSIFSVILAFFVGRAFFGVRAGLIAAMIQTIFPLDARFASILLPDLPAAFWTNIGVLFLCYGINQTTALLKTVYGFLSGLAFGLSWLCKETVLYLLPFILIFMIWAIHHRKKDIVIFISVSLTVTAILLAESLIYYKYTHIFFYRLHALEKMFDGSEGKAWHFVEGGRFGWSEGRYWYAVFKRIIKDGPRAIFISRAGIVTLPAILAIGYAAFRKLSAFLLPSIWFLSLVFMFNFGSTSLKLYRPLVLLSRHIYILFLPAIVLIGGLIDVLIPSRISIKEKINRKRFFWGSLLALSIIFICLLDVCHYIKVGAYNPVEREISSILTPINDKIYTDPETANFLEFFWKNPKKAQIYDFNGMGTDDLPTEIYVLINRKRLNFLNSSHEYVLPKFYKNIPNHWLLKWSKYGAELYWVPAETKKSSYKRR